MNTTLTAEEIELRHMRLVEARKAFVRWAAAYAEPAFVEWLLATYGDDIAAGSDIGTMSALLAEYNAG